MTDGDDERNNETSFPNGTEALNFMHARVATEC